LTKFSLCLKRIILKLFSYLSYFFYINSGEKLFWLIWFIVISCLSSIFGLLLFLLFIFLYLGNNFIFDDFFYFFFLNFYLLDLLFYLFFGLKLERVFFRFEIRWLNFGFRFLFIFWFLLWYRLGYLFNRSLLFH
jgi:hypothetical protein